MKVSVWNGCYDLRWGDLITSESFSHPAKFAPGLIDRIYKHGLEQAYWQKGDLIGDPFGGIACGGIKAAFNRLRWYGVELEEKFVSLGRQNIEMHRPAWESYGFPVPVLVQGDSRRFSEIAVASGIVTSPPYANCLTLTHNGIDWEKADPKWRTSKRKDTPGRSSIANGYGKNPANIGNLRMDSIITSPPFANDQPCASQSKLKGKIQKKADGKRFVFSNPLNIGNLRIDSIVTSPPYADAVSARSHGIDWAKAGPATGNRKRGEGTRHESTLRAQLNYSPDPANIGNLKIDAICTSPPWEKGAEGAFRGGKWRSPKDALAAGRGHGASDAARLRQLERDEQKTYGDAPGQIGNDSGETYWQAMRQVYAECWKALKPGGHMAVVVKACVKNKKKVHLPQQTLKLLLHLGFEPVERIKAMLVKEETQPGLFGEIRKRTERKSFFRRLAEKKGSPRIDWEEVLIVRKP